MNARSFARRLDVLPELFAFTAVALDAADRDLVGTVDFVLEELFTNVVRYGAGHLPVVVTIHAIDRGVEVAFDEPEADAFDPTAAPEVDVTAPLDVREPGGLGLHLLRKLVDTWACTYDPASRLRRITFRTTRSAPARSGA